MITLLDVLQMINIPEVLNAGWKERCLHPAPSWKLCWSNTAPLTRRAVLSLQLGTLKWAIFASSEVSFLRFSFAMGKGTDSSLSSFILVENRKLLEMLGSLSEIQGSPCPPKYLLIAWEQTMERERAKSAGPGTAGRC